MAEFARLPDEHPTLRVVAMPADTNASGDIFGGWIMSQVDIAGAIAAIRHVGGRVATVAVNALHFKQPVFVGDLISCYAAVEKTGTTSITIGVQVYAERNRLQHETVKVTEAVLTYVALDDKGRPRPINADA